MPNSGHFGPACRITTNRSRCLRCTRFTSRTSSRARGMRRKSFFGPLGLDAAILGVPGAQLPVPTVVELFERARTLTGNPGIGIQLGLQMRASAHGYLGFAAMTASTLREALETATRFVPTRTNAIGLSLHVSGSSASLVIEQRADFGPAQDCNPLRPRRRHLADRRRAHGAGAHRFGGLRLPPASLPRGAHRGAAVAPFRAAADAARLRRQRAQLAADHGRPGLAAARVLRARTVARGSRRRPGRSSRAFVAPSRGRPAASDRSKRSPAGCTSRRARSSAGSRRRA